MKIHRLSDKEIDALNIPIQKYEEDIKFKDFKEQAMGLLGESGMKYLKYLLALYVVIDLYSYTNPERKNILMKLMERMGLKKTTIEKIDKSLKMGLSASYITLFLINKKNESKTA